MVRAGAALSDQSATAHLEVWKSPACGCCGKWAEHMKHNGFAVTTNDVDYGILDKLNRIVVFQMPRI